MTTQQLEAGIKLKESYTRKREMITQRIYVAKNAVYTTAESPNKATREYYQRETNQRNLDKQAAAIQQRQKLNASVLQAAEEELQDLEQQFIKDLKKL
jgi:hypothetical protein